MQYHASSADGVLGTTEEVGLPPRAGHLRVRQAPTLALP
jgi:hypothetical protein